MKLFLFDKTVGKIWMAVQTEWNQYNVCCSLLTVFPKKTDETAVCIHSEDIIHVLVHVTLL